jgi:hypothetical protein
MTEEFTLRMIAEAYAGPDAYDSDLAWQTPDGVAAIIEELSAQARLHAARAAFLAADNERWRAWMTHFAHVSCLSEMLGEGMCESGEECPGCAARAALLEAE